MSDNILTVKMVKKAVEEMKNLPFTFGVEYEIVSPEEYERRKNMPEYTGVRKKELG